MTLARNLVACVFVVAALPVMAEAQVGSRIALGAGVGLVVPSEDHMSPQVSVGPLFRFGENEKGWAPAIGLGWTSGVLDGSLGAADGEYAEVRIRPVMAGVSHTWHHGQWSYEASLTAGYAFNSVDLLDEGRRIFPGASNVDVEISNSFALAPRFRAWYDVNNRVGWMVGTSLMFTRPELTFQSGSSTVTKQVGGASLQLNTGIAFRVY